MSRPLRPVAALAGKANGKPNTNRDYELQGREAAQHGYAEADCPYYATSTAERCWLKGFRS